MAQPVAEHRLSRGSLVTRLRDNAAVLLAAYRRHRRRPSSAGRVITPAAEWLLDNYHLVEEQIREIRDDLPPGYYRQLPKLAAGPFAGYPRVFGARVGVRRAHRQPLRPGDAAPLRRAYQRVQPLTIGELWAVAITLRIVLIENLQRAARRPDRQRPRRARGGRRAGRPAARRQRRSGARSRTCAWSAIVGRCCPSASPCSSCKRLRDQDPRITPALGWLEERLSAARPDPDAVVRDEQQRQGASNVTVRNIITSMRLISDIDWAELFESVSLVDEELRAGSDFAAMDFATPQPLPQRDRAAGARLGARELEIARARAAGGEAPTTRRTARRSPQRHAERDSDPGYHLIAGGRRALRSDRSASAPRGCAGRGDSACASASRGYVGAIALLGGILLAAPLLGLHARGVDAPQFLRWLALLGVRFRPLDVAVAARQPRGDWRLRRDASCRGSNCAAGVPASLRTLVAVPTLLLDRRGRPARADRAPRGPLPRERRRRAVLRAAGRLGAMPIRAASQGDDAAARRRPPRASTR